MAGVGDASKHESIFAESEFERGDLGRLSLWLSARREGEVEGETASSRGDEALEQGKGTSTTRGTGWTLLL